MENLGATDDLVRDDDDLQAQLQQGPCLDAIWEHEQVHSGDIAAEARWPDWGRQMREKYGVQSMLCTRMFTNETTVGALNLYATERYAFDQPARDAATLVAAHSAVAVAAAQQIESLQVAVDHRTTTGKAIGIVMERYGLTDDQALDVLRRLSSQANRRIYDIALDLIATGNLPG